MNGKISLVESMLSLDEEKVKMFISESLTSDVPAEKIIEELQQGMMLVGDRFEKHQYFIPELILAGEIMKNSLALLKPYLKGDSDGENQKVVMGTVFGDVHNLGKDIVVTVLRGNGFAVKDLGEDVKPDDFVKSIHETGTKLVGLSVLLTMSFEAVSNTVKAIEDAGLRDQVKIMLGGQPVTELVRINTGCDYYGETAINGVRIAKRVYGAV